MWQVPTISSERVAAIVNEELGASMESVFDTFEMQPLAGASLGQVHRATYLGKQVAVKIQRDQLEALFDTDFRNIRLMCRGLNALERLRERVRRLRGKGRSAVDRDWLQYACTLTTWHLMAPSGAK